MIVYDVEVFHVEHHLRSLFHFWLLAKRRAQMELDWSAQSPHIRTLFRPWQLGDGYDEATIQEVETRLGIRLPAKLRNFYLAWGKRKDMTEAVDPLLSPEHLAIKEDALMFWVEHQAHRYWGVSC